MLFSDNKTIFDYAQSQCYIKSNLLVCVFLVHAQGMWCYVVNANIFFL